MIYIFKLAPAPAVKLAPGRFLLCGVMRLHGGAVGIVDISAFAADIRAKGVQSAASGRGIVPTCKKPLNVHAFVYDFFSYDIAEKKAAHALSIVGG